MKKIFVGILILSLLWSCAYTPGGYDVYRRGKLVVIHEKVGETIDPWERDEYGLFKEIEGFESASFYEIADGGYEAIIETEDGAFFVVNRDPKSLEILHEWIEQYHVCQNDEMAERHFMEKWGIVDSDTLGFFITKGEINKGKGQYATIGGMSCCLLGFIPANLAAMSQISIWIDPFSGEAGTTGEDRAYRMFTIVLIGSTIAGIGLGLGSSAKYIKVGIKNVRHPRKVGLSIAAPVMEEGMPIVISEKVGEIMGPSEREILGMFKATEGFKQAVFLQFKDGSYAVDIFYEEDGEERRTRLPQSKESIEYIQKYIEECEELPLNE